MISDFVQVPHSYFFQEDKMSYSKRESCRANRQYDRLARQLGLSICRVLIGSETQATNEKGTHKTNINISRGQK